MKKVLSLLIIASMALSIASCTSGISNLGNKYIAEESSTGTDIATGSGSGSGTVGKSTVEQKKGFDEQQVLNNLVTTTYAWNTSSYYYVALVVKNNSKYDCNVEANMVFKNDAGQTVGADGGYLFAFEAGAESCIVLSNDEPFYSYDYTYSVEEAILSPATSDLSCETTTTDKKALVTLTNTSDEAIDSVSHIVLFMNGNEVVYYGNGFTSNLGPGKSVTEESSYYNRKATFDSVKVYYSGYRTNY